jgi:enoyl-CoA hydratase
LRAIESAHRLRLVFDRAEQHNKLDPDTVDALRASLANAVARREVRLVELHGEGPTWCAGADLQAVAAHPGGLPGAVRGYADLLADLAECDLPVMAVVEGHVRGGGVGLLAAADLVVMGPRANVSLPEAGVGLWPMMVGPLLGRVMSARQAMALALTGVRLGMEDCLRVGLATHVGDDPQGVADLLAARVVGQAPDAVRAGRRAWRAHAGFGAPDLRARLHALGDALVELSAAPEAAEGIAAYFEKRAPVW